MRKKIILFSILVTLQSCTSLRSIFYPEDPYGRGNGKPVKEVNYTNIKTEKTKRTKSKTTKKEIYRPEVNYTNIKKDKKLTAEEQRLYDEIYNPKVKEEKSEYKPSYITITEDGKNVLRLMKRYYNLIESYDIMEMKTKEAVIKLKQAGNTNVNSLQVIKEIHEIIKETKTRSYVLATARVLRNRGIK
ncbi:MAG: hypothetical protein CR959_00390 [Fusobacteriales bacterium]|nr:MAG: hypothetical protein CR959_00390 [Fusobacteriales bacterium]